jgi:tetratricopeptide (TPR) repeat protein
MKYFSKLFFVASAAVFFSGGVLAQTDELRSATGLPIQIGQNALFGQVTIKGLRKEDAKPIVFVTLLEGGTQLGRIQTNDTGYYYFLTMPRGSGTLVFEVNSNEVGRMLVSAPPGGRGNLRQDIELDWQEFKQRIATGVVSARESYSRDAGNTKAFDAAMLHVGEKKFDKAMPLLEAVVTKDPKDYVAWTEMGTVYFKNNALDNAEACYFKAIELKKDYFVALLNLGKLYYSRKQFDNSILVLSNAVKVKADSAEAYHYLGESYLQSKKGSLAVPAMNEAIKLAPVEKADLHLRLASLYDGAGMKGKAATEYKLFLQKRPDHPEKAQLEKYIADNPPK